MCGRPVKEFAMKKIVPLLLIVCLLLSACVKIESKSVGGEGAQSSAQGSATNPGSSDNVAGGGAQESPTAADPLMLYPAYLQTPLDMPVMLDAETYPAGKKLTWSSSNPSVATVDAEGCVTPVSVGETVITCALADDANVTATCGVLVVAEGKILLWEYPPEPADLDAAIVQMEAEDAEQAANGPGLPWPDAWPDELPKMEGKVIESYGDGPEASGGLGVYLTVQGKDVAEAYALMLVSTGFKKGKDITSSGYYTELTGKGYKVTVFYEESTKNCTLIVSK